LYFLKLDIIYIMLKKFPCPLTRLEWSCRILYDFSSIFIRFLRWIRRNAGWWYLICTPNEEHMNMSMMMKMLIQRLAKDSFMKSSLSC